MNWLFWKLSSGYQGFLQKLTTLFFQFFTFYTLLLAVFRAEAINNNFYGELPKHLDSIVLLKDKLIFISYDKVEANS